MGARRQRPFRGRADRVRRDQRRSCGVGRVRVRVRVAASGECVGMKRLAGIAMLLMVPRLLAAQPLDVAAFLGEDWYGLYLNGQKSGYMMSSIAQEKDGTIVVVEDVRFKMLMQNVRQDLSTLSKRVYSADGALLRIEQTVQDSKGTSAFTGVVGTGGITLTSNVGGVAKTDTYPVPKESLRDALKQSMLANPGAKVGDTIAFSMFEPTMGVEDEGRSEIKGEEVRVLEGVSTKVLKIETQLKLMNLSTVSYVTENGTLLEDITAGMITMRLEPKEVAQDVTYVNDVLVANAAYVDKPIEDPRGRKTLRLAITGPLSSAHLFNDERQFLAQKGNGFEFTGRAIALDGFTPATLPIAETSVIEWTKPTRFVQSDDPKIVETARAVAGGETDALKVSEKLCAWVYDNVQTSFSARLTNALEVLDSLEGDCTEHSVLFVALARAAGLPAREVAGLIYMDGGKPGFYFHEWAKVW
ncbi:MAG: transglutaminase domain-containing protein, partial [Candidatus Hydrogenedentes bacterium]|nr:transglutaminase domain-containing protein [Candidatus Hydrogenedentota bacterium]